MDTFYVAQETWLDRLLAEPDPDRRISLSMEAGQELAGARGVSYWVEAREGEFLCQRELGLVQPCVPTESISLVAKGKWDPVQANHQIIVTGYAPNRMAWTVTRPFTHEHHTDALEAFFFLVQTLHPYSEEDGGPSLLPSDPDVEL